MTKLETMRLETLYRQADKLMSSPPSLNPTVTNADVVEAMLWDLQRVINGKAPTSLAELIERDSQ